MKFFITYIITFLGSLFFPSPPKYELISNKVVSQTSKNISESENLNPIGSGGSMMEDVKMLSISFITKELINKERGRELIHQCANQLISNVNQNEEIRPYLHNYPFTYKNVEIRIFNRDKNSISAVYPELSTVSLIDGIIYYKYYENNTRKKVLTETFEEAEKILNEKKAN